MVSWIMADHRKGQAMIRSLEFSAPALLKMELMIDHHAYVMKPPEKPINMGSGRLPS